MSLTEIEIIHRHLQDTAMQKLALHAADTSRSRRGRRYSHAPLAWTRSGSGREPDFGPLGGSDQSHVSGSGVRILKLQSELARTAGVILGEVAEEMHGSFETIKRDEKAAGPRTCISPGGAERPNIAAGDGFLRDVEQACRDSAHRERAYWKKTFLLADMETDFLEPANGSRISRSEVESKLRESCNHRWKTPCSCWKPICAAFGRNCRTRSKRNSTHDGKTA